MKKRTVCFGWTKKFQRRVAHAADLMRSGQHELATKLIASVKADHRARVEELRGVVW